MNSIDDAIKLEERTTLGKGLGGLRKDGNVPAVIHNRGKDSIHVMGTEKELLKIYQVAGKHHPLNLVVGKSKYLALIKDAHFNPVRHQLQHIVFQAISATEKVEAEIPIHMEGEIPAEKVGLMVLTQLDAVVVEALPHDLPDQLVLDVSKLAELHDKLTVADLKAPTGVTILTEAEHPIVTVVETKAQMSDEAEDTAEGEVGEEGQDAEGAEDNAAGVAKSGNES